MNFNAFLETLPIMGMGMLGIFAVIFVVFLLVLGLNRWTRSKNEQ